MSKLRVIVVDDERPARAFLAGILNRFEDVEVVGEAAGGAECVEMIEQLSPDLVLLDLQMPEVDGLGVVRLVRRDKLPLIAFVTAYDEYAVRAFEMNAVDYLLKPVDPARLRATVNRAMERLERADLRPGTPIAFVQRQRNMPRPCRPLCCAGFRCASVTTSFSFRSNTSCLSLPTGSCFTSSPAPAIATRSPTASRTSRRGSIRRNSFVSLAVRC